MQPQSPLSFAHSNPSVAPTASLLKPLCFATRLALSGMLAAGLAGHACAEAVAELPAVQVSADLSRVLSRPYAGGQVARGGRLGMLGNADAMKSPFSISSYTSQMVQDQQAATVADVLAKDASVRASQTGGVVDSFFIRGFPIGEGNLGEVALDGLYGVAPNYRVFTEYAERVEVIKGPAALLYGMSPNSGVGGVINVVPKRALAEDLTRFTADYASDAQGGGHLDVSRRFGTDEQFGVRFNGSHHQGDTAVDKQSRTADVGALSLDYRGERFKATLDLISQQEEFDAPSRPFLVAAGVAVPSAPDGQNNVTQQWAWSKINDRSAMLRTEYELSDKLALFANVGAAHTEVSRLSDQTPTILNAAGDTTATPMHFKFDIERFTADAGARARFDTGPVRHAVTLQASTYRDQLARGSTSGTAVQSNIYSPVDSPSQNVGAPSLVPKVSETTLSGVALADTLSLLDERLQLMVGVRRQQVESDNFNATTGAVMSSYDKSAVTPLFGIVFKPWEKVSLYANRIEGLSKGDIAPATASNSGEVFAPYKSKQYEVGVKIDHGGLMTTVSAFQITKPSGQLTNGVFAVDAEQRNRGLELNVAGEVAKSVRLFGGVTLLDAELTKTNSSTTRGKEPVGVPSVQANLNAEWDTPWLSGLTLTGGVVYTGKQYVNQANTQSLPSWTKVDVGTRYRTRIDGKPTTFRAGVQNVFNRDYWSGVASYSTLSQGAPRTLQLSATVDF